MDLTNRRRLRVQRRPDADSLQNSAAAVGQRGGALIKARLRGGAMWNGLNERNAQMQRRKRGRERRTHHAAADNGHIEAHRSASMASGVFSSAPVRTSGAPWVTSTSSSIRIPMFQNSFGTLGEGRI